MDCVGVLVSLRGFGTKTSLKIQQTTQSVRPIQWEPLKWWELDCKSASSHLPYWCGHHSFKMESSLNAYRNCLVQMQLNWLKSCPWRLSNCPLPLPESLNDWLVLKSIGSSIDNHISCDHCNWIKERTKAN